MSYTIYADILFVLNFAVDLICICISLYICKFKRKPIKTTASALVGGIYSVIALMLEDTPLYLRLSVHICMLIIICCIATPSKYIRDIFKVSLVFFGVCSLSGGLITSLFSSMGKYSVIGGGIYIDLSPISLLILILLFITLSIPFFINTGKRISLKTARISISLDQGEITFDALIDSGNLLCDPVSGDGIILLKHGEFKEIFKDEQLQAIKALDVLSDNFPCGIRLISWEKGLLPIIRPKNTEIRLFGIKGKKSVSALLGIDFSTGTYGGVCGLIPSSYIE